MPRRPSLCVGGNGDPTPAQPIGGNPVEDEGGMDRTEAGGRKGEEGGSWEGTRARCGGKWPRSRGVLFRGGDTAVMARRGVNNAAFVVLGWQTFLVH